MLYVLYVDMDTPPHAITITKYSVVTSGTATRTPSISYTASPYLQSMHKPFVTHPM